jgi:Na+/melibiose symporter-like transporter
VSRFLASLPLWLAALLVVVLPTAAAMAGPILIRRRFSLERLTTNNEIAGFKFATVGVIYAVLLAFAVIIVWERYSDAESAVIQEAGAAATLYRLAAPADPQSVAMRNALDRYLQTAIERDWPQMSHVRASPETTRALNDLYAAALSLAQDGARPPAVLVEMFHQLDQITEARRTRLHLSYGIVPGMLWTVLILGGTLTVSFTFFFGTRNLEAQVLMTGVLALIVFMGLLVIVSINHPFTGPVHIDSEPLQLVLGDFGHR